MRKVFLLALLLAVSQVAQTTNPGTVNVNTTITAIAGTPVVNGTLTCTYTPNDGLGSVATICTLQGTASPLFTGSVIPPIGMTAGFTVGATVGANSVTAIITPATAAGGPMGYQVAANGVSKSGSF